MVILVLILLLLILASVLIYKKGTANEDYFKFRQIPYLKPKFMFGNASQIFKHPKTMLGFAVEMSHYQNDSRVVGMYDMRNPMVLINDPQLIKQLTVKEFDHFTDHQFFVDDSMDKLFGNSLFFMRGQKWRDMRATLSPAFTGSKMRHMFNYVGQVTRQMTDYLRKECEKSPGGVFQAEIKEEATRLMNDIIAVCAFGCSVNSFEDRENEFFISGKKLMNFNSPLGFMKFFGYRLTPGLMKFFNIQLFDKRTRTFFKSLILGTLEDRWTKGIHQNDVIDVLMKAQQKVENDHDLDEKDSAGFATVQESEVGKAKHKRVWTEDELVAQAFLFFLAGFDTSSSLMSFAIYEITVNPDIQQRLFEEITEAEESHGKLSYDNLKDLKYLDMVVSETLRLWPPFPIIDRACTKDLKYEDADLTYTFEKGTGICLNVAGIQHNEKYFPDPLKFDPERFSEENKGSIDPDTFLTFGQGPRACIGSRFALMEVKIMLYYLLLNFELVAVERTEVPLQLKNTMGGLLSKNGIWVGFRKRESSQ